MKLLPKKQIDNRIASESKAQIDEAVLIVKKTDALRQTLASLESQHSQFSERVKFELHEQTRDLVRNVESLKKELAELIEKRAKALEPLDSAWAEVKAKLKQIDFTLNDVVSRNESLKLEEEKITKKLKEAKDSAYRIKVREKELERAYIMADELKSEANKILIRTTDGCLSKSKEVDEKLHQASIVETALDNLKKHLDGRSIEQDYREQELNGKEKAINDKYATYERTINRTKNIR